MPRTAVTGGVIGNFIGKPGRLVGLFTIGRVRGMGVFNLRFDRTAELGDNRGVGIRVNAEIGEQIGSAPVNSP